MTKKENEEEKVEKVEHQNIFEALAAFQGENFEIKKTKQFGKDDDKMKFMYASLDDVIRVVSPFTSKHGLSFSWQGKERIECVLTHTSTKYEMIGNKKETEGEKETLTPIYELTNTIRSLPVTVARSGDMKTIGNHSTYARRYTLCEVLGIASEEDRDAPNTEQTGKNANKTAYTLMKEKLGTLNAEDLKKRIVTIEKELATLASGKASALGLTKDQYTELIDLAKIRIGTLESGLADLPVIE